MREDTDILDVPHGQDLNSSWSISHPSGPIVTPARRPAVTAREKDERVRRRPHRRYRDPKEMWAWHAVRMAVVFAWTFVLIFCGVMATAGVVILGEFWQ